MYFLFRSCIFFPVRIRSCRFWVAGLPPYFSHRTCLPAALVVWPRGGRSLLLDRFRHILPGLLSEHLGYGHAEL